MIYRSEGVCIITDIKHENFGVIGKDEEYYFLSPLNDRKSTVYVPVANKNLIGMMRKLLSADEITEMAAELREERLDWIPDSRLRNSSFKDILAIGDRCELIRLANTVSEKLNEQTLNGKKPSATDLGALKRPIHLLYEEFSATTDISSPDDVLAVLAGELKLGAKVSL